MRAALIGAAIVGLCVLTVALISMPEVRRAARPTLERVGLLSRYQEGARYRKILERHEQENRELAARCVLLLGDSLTEAFPTALAEPRGWVVRGISGDRVRHARARLGPSVLSAPCTVVAVLIGSNDLVMDGSDPAAVAGEIASLVEALRSARRQVILMTLPPTRGRHAEANARIRALNAQLELLSGPGLRVVDLHGALANEAGELDARHSRDGLHLARAAYERWAQLLREMLSTQL